MGKAGKIDINVDVDIVNSTAIAVVVLSHHTTTLSQQRKSRPKVLKLKTAVKCNSSSPM